MATLKDIARKVGVDVSTVSKVLQGAPIRVSEETRERIHHAARLMEYRPNVAARALRLGRSGAIGLVMETATNYLHTELIAGAGDAAEAHGYCLFLVKEPGHDAAQRLIKLIEQGRIDGLLHAEGILSREVVMTYESHQTPYISLNKPMFGEGPFVSLDDESGFEYQADHILRSGHRKIVFVSMNPRSYVADICREAFVRRVRQHEAEGASVHVLKCDFFGEEVEALIDAIQGLDPQPTAIAISGLMVSVRLIEAFRARGVAVPGTYSILGYHDAPIADWTVPGVSTIKMPSYRQGYLGVERLIGLLRGEGFTGQLVDESPTFVSRGSFLPLR